MVLPPQQKKGGKIEEKKITLIYKNDDPWEKEIQTLSYRNIV